MFSYSNTSLAPPTRAESNPYNQNLSPTSYLTDSHYKSTPNVAFSYDNQTEQRRLSDGPLLRLPNYNIHLPDEFGGSESCMFKQKNSSLSMLLDSTSSMMRTASTTFQCLIGSVRRASFCGEPDPTIQLSANGNSGSLYLFSGGANSHESSMSNISHEDYKRTVTIYDGRIPAAPFAPTIPFELMTPIDAITQTIDDPVESFVQIVLEEPDDRPPVIQPFASSSRRSSISRHRHRSASPSSLPLRERLITSNKSPAETQSLPITELFNSMEIYSQPPAVVEPMDFSFLEPVLRGQSAAPPPMRTPTSRQKSPQTSPTDQDLVMDFQPSSSPTNRNDRSSDNSIPFPSRLQLPFSTD